MTGFEYPTEPHRRKHGPDGYNNYGSYRDWLRDEFMFRCVYCLHREQWYSRGATFHVDHFTPVAQDAGAKLSYPNLLYACATCNEAKNAIVGLPNPCELAFGELVRVLPDGRVEPLNKVGEKLCEALRLGSESNIRWRARWIRTIQALKDSHPMLYEDYMGFPPNLPDLEAKKVRSNKKPEGAKNCFFALRRRGELPKTY